MQENNRSESTVAREGQRQEIKDGCVYLVNTEL